MICCALYPEHTCKNCRSSCHAIKWIACEKWKPYGGTDMALCCVSAVPNKNTPKECFSCPEALDNCSKEKGKIFLEKVTTDYDGKWEDHLPQSWKVAFLGKVRLGLTKYAYAYGVSNNRGEKISEVVVIDYFYDSESNAYISDDALADLVQEAEESGNIVEFAEI